MILAYKKYYTHFIFSMPNNFHITFQLKHIPTL